MKRLSASAIALPVLISTYHPCLAAQLEEIVVTAQARSESLQDVPIAIDAVQGEYISEQVILDVRGLADQIPAVTALESPFQPMVFIRGFGSGGGNRLYEQSAPFFIDGVFGGRAKQFLSPFFDIERVEVIKGPQAIFFGKNATAGAISIHSARPSSELEGGFNASYELEQDGYVAEAFVSGPLSERLSGRLSGRVSRRGAYMTDLAAGDDAGEIDDYALRASLVWSPSDSVEMYAKLEHSEREQDGRLEQLYCGNSDFTEIIDPLSGESIECIEDQRNSTGAVGGPLVNINPPGSEFSDADATSGVINFNFDDLFQGHTLESITGYSGYESDEAVGADFSKTGVTVGFTEEDFRQFTQEFRLKSPEDQFFTYTLGLFYMDQKHDVDGYQVAILPVIAGDYMLVSQDAEAWSVFARGSFNISDSWRLSVAARYTDETKEYDADVYRIDGLPATQVSIDDVDPGMATRTQFIDLDREESAFDPTITLEWYVSEEVNLYATYAEGSKAGGFEHLPRSSLEFPLPEERVEFEEENATNYELGIKSTLANGSVRANAAIFHTRYDDVQVQIFNGAALGFQTQNADEATIEGIEGELVWQLDDVWRIGASATLLNAEFDEFINELTREDLSGNDMINAPDEAMSAYVDFSLPFGNDLLFRGNLTVNHTGERAQTENNVPQDYADSYTVANLRLGLGSSNGSWEVYLQGVNITDEDDIRSFANPSALTQALPVQDPRMAVLAPPRTLFAGFRLAF